MLPVSSYVEKNKYLVNLFYGSSGMDQYDAPTLEIANIVAREKLSAIQSGAWVEIIDCAMQTTVKTIGKNIDGSLTEVINKCNSK